MITRITGFGCWAVSPNLALPMPSLPKSVNLRREIFIPSKFPNSFKPCRSALRAALLLVLALVVYGHQARADDDQEKLAALPTVYHDGPGRLREYMGDRVEERIDPFSGKLQLIYTDIYLPGPAGLDIKVLRTYTNLDRGDIGERTDLGTGWNLHFGRLLRRNFSSMCNTMLAPDEAPVFEEPNRSRHIFYLSQNEQYFIDTGNWRMHCPNGNVPIVKAPDGTQYEMGRSGFVLNGVTPMVASYVTKIEDPYGNWIKVDYTGTDPTISSITASDGRTVTFEYLNGRLISVTGGGKTVTYTHESVPNILEPRHRLVSATLPDIGVWSYDYYPSGGMPGNFCVKSVTNPRGGQVTYEYDEVRFAVPISIPSSTVVRKKSYLSGQLGPTEYAYIPATARYTSGPYVDEQFDRTIVTGPLKKITYKHVGYNTAALNAQSSGLLYAIGILVEKEVADKPPGAAQWRRVELESFGYTGRIISNQPGTRPGTPVSEPQVAAPVLTGRVVVREGVPSATSYSNHDEFGNPQRIVETGTDTRATNITYENDIGQWILGLRSSENIEGVGVINRQFNGKGDVSIENRFGVVTTFGYYGSGDLAWRKDANAHTTSYDDYSRGIPRTETRPEDVVITRTVDGRGNITSQSDGTPNPPTRYTYDGADRLTSITPPMGNPILIDWFSPDPASQLRPSKKVTRGSAVEITKIDSLYRPFNVVSTDIATSISNYQDFQYDQDGRRVFVSYPNSSRGVGFEYDGLDRVTKIKHNYDPSTQSFDASREIVDKPPERFVKNERGYSTRLIYRTYGDAVNKELMVIEPPDSRANMTIERNGLGQPTTITQAGMTRTYTYEKYFLVSSTDPEIGTVTYGRDNVGNMTSRKVGNEAATIFTYDGLNRLRTIDYADTTPDVVKTYYKNSLLKTLENGIANRSFNYDANGNLDSETLQIDGRNFLVDYAYDASDGLQSIQYHSGRSVSYAPDAWGRATSADPYVTSLTRYPSGQIATMRHRNGVTTSTGQNNRLWPSSLKLQNGTGAFVDSTYGYDAAGNIESITDPDSSFNRTMTYDPLDRLSTASGAWGGGLFRYDGRGNITDQSFGANKIIYSYNDTTGLLGTALLFTGPNLYFTNELAYDTHGNVRKNMGVEYQYSKADQMVCALCNAPERVDYTYDGAGMRVRARDRLGSTYFMYGQGGKLLWEELPSGRFKEYFYLDGKQVATQEQ